MTHKAMKRLCIFLFVILAIVLPASADDGNNSYAENIRLGDSCMAVYDVTHALVYYRTALAEQSSSALLMRISNSYYRQNNYAKCLSMLDNVPLDSLDHDTMRHLFDACQALGLQQRAVEMGEAVVSRWTMDGEMVAELAREYLSTGNDSKAEKLCDNYWMRDETCMAVNNMMADIYMVQRKWTLARDSYLLLLQQGDSTYKNMLNLGVCCEWLGKTDEARKAFDVAIAMSDSTTAAPLYHQGAVLNSLKDYDASMACFCKALTLLQPDSSILFSCYRGVAEGYYARNDFQHALHDFLQAQDYAPASVTTPYYIGICYEALGDKPRANAAYQRFLQLAMKEETIGAELKRMMEDAGKRIK